MFNSGPVPIGGLSSSLSYDDGVLGLSELEAPKEAFGTIRTIALARSGSREIQLGHWVGDGGQPDPGWDRGDDLPRENGGRLRQVVLLAVREIDRLAIGKGRGYSSEKWIVLRDDEGLLGAVARGLEVRGDGASIKGDLRGGGEEGRQLDEIPVN
jgi:hypothetical protein